MSGRNWADDFGEGQLMSREAYHHWAAEQPRGRFERIDGRVVMMAPERLIHAKRKAMVWLALRRAVRDAGLPCEVYPDGVTIEVDDSDFEPDTILRCGPELADNAVAVPDPVVLVEVLSPGTKAIDLTRKPVAYFRLPSLRHYLIVWPDQRKIVHHRRPSETDMVQTEIISVGDIVLAPPGLVTTVDEIYSD